MRRASPQALYFQLHCSRAHAYRIKRPENYPRLKSTSLIGSLWQNDSALIHEVNNMEVVTKFVNLFGRPKSVIIGMIHLPALPGTPRNCLVMKDIVRLARHDAEIYKQARVDSVLVENMHDVPYLPGAQIGPEVVSAMTAACVEVKDVFQNGPVGVQILAGANQQALAVAIAAGLDYIRAEGYVFSHVADEGIMDACAGSLLRYRKQIGAEHIQIFTDIKKKHSSHAITSDISVTEMSTAAEFFQSDGVILTGTSTGAPASIQEMKDVQQSIRLPVLIGSGVTKDNYQEYSSANGLIIGSYFKKGGNWQNPVESKRVMELMEIVRKKLENSKL
ncbi:hypothetical protein CHS0354_022553 [Potamilus streckersoni]|uniref:Uncharacterized protein n=1 Tax=Potamilus streckersoni TaxID=2493646 RepID=A0AAE0TBW3_9BIVA|nr:hypothetical protein CHS0354_022553 [Potamilus streckersoni]